MTPLKLAEIEAAKRYQSNSFFGIAERAAFISGWNEAVLKCSEELLKQLHDMVHINGYPCEAVPKATILSLHALLGATMTPPSNP